MATWAHHKELADLGKLKALLEHRGLYISRPLVVHERNETGEKCPCGCDSRFAIAVDTIEHIDLLIEPREGTRVLKQALPTARDREEFDELAAEAKLFYLPRRVSRAQLKAMRCKAKVLAIFGGVRAGKSSYIADDILDEGLMHGGHGSQLWWVAPTLEKTEIGLRKLVVGEAIGRGGNRRKVAPLLPSELVRYVPSSTRADRKYIEAVDFTRWHFKYAGSDGGNLKGDPPQQVVMDEACEVVHRENYGEILRRIMESDGRLLMATTPKAGHWAKEEVYDRGVHVDDWKPGDHVAWIHITCFDNPWVSERMIQDTIDTIKDPQEIRREIYGEWVGSGPLLWRHFDESEQIITDSSYRLPRDMGLVDITQDTIERFYLGQRPARHLGQDFNLHPMCSVEIQVAHHPKDPKRTPIVIVPDEVVGKVGTIYEHMDALERRGYAGSGVSCDATGAQFNSYRLAHGIKDKNSTQAKEMRRRGFICKPCRISSSGNAANPSQLEKVNPLHRLMMERITLSDGTQLPRFLIHSRAAKTLIALRTQESDDRGNPAKESNTVSDRVSGPTDALCYGVFPLAGLLFPGEGSGVRLE
jgi:hypothetical protein